MSTAAPAVTDSTSSEQRDFAEAREDATRFQVDATKFACHVAFRQTRRHAFRVACSLLDLNANGAAIQYRLPRALPKSASTTLLEIENLGDGDSMLLLSRVCWSRQIGLDQFRSGLQFRRAIPESMILSGISLGGLTRRGAKRDSFALGATVRQSEPLLVEEVTLICCSQTGAQVVSATPLAPGSRLMLQLSDQTGVVGKVAWCSARATGVFTAGIAFVKRTDGRAFYDNCLQMRGSQAT
ncbi:MAG: PilZ domain-containing protein [Planctomycetota bacterium]